MLSNRERLPSWIEFDQSTLTLEISYDSLLQVGEYELLTIARIEDEDLEWRNSFKLTLKSTETQEEDSMGEGSEEEESQEESASEESNEAIVTSSSLLINGFTIDQADDPTDKTAPDAWVEKIN